MEKAILVGVELYEDSSFEYSMQELESLSGALNIETKAIVTQKLDNSDNATYIGKGKAEEIATMVKGMSIDTVIFNDELSPANIRNLENIIPCRVIDRTVLILNIFSERAKTKEAKLQVEIAELQYMLPRLVGLRESLGRQHGGGSGGTLNKGLGEKKLELDRRKIEQKISLLNKELEKLVLNRQNQRRRRKKNQVPVVAIVGYTNAGKSTLLNSIIEVYRKEEDKKVFEKDMLFATLETSVRNIQIENNKEVLFTDTVGFVSKLPHFLIKAFRSTLEEVKEADLLLHIVDFSNPDYLKQVQITRNVLQEIGVENIQEVIIYNKIDLINIEHRIKEPGVLYISAKKQEDIRRVIAEVNSHIFGENRNFEFMIPYDKANIEAYFRKNGDIKQIEYKDEGISFTVECSRDNAMKHEEYVVREMKI